MGDFRREKPTTPRPAAASPWAAGIAVATGLLMMVSGTFQALAGVTALLNDGFFPAVRNHAFELTPTTWGWIHVVTGIFVVVVGRFIVRGESWRAPPESA